QLRLRSVIVAVEHVHLEPHLRADQRREQTDRPRAGDERDARFPRRRALANAAHMLPGLGNNAGRLHQHAEHAERWVELDQEVRFDAEILRAVAVTFLDAALGVLAVAAHVPDAGGAGWARHGIWSAHDAGDEVARLEAGARRRFLHPAERFMTEDQALLARRGSTVVATDDLAVSAADAERQRLHQHVAVALWRLLDSRQVYGIRRPGQ